MHVVLCVRCCVSHSQMNPVVSSLTQFLCLKNIRTFLAACSENFGMKKSELFEAFDLFDVRDFGKVRPDLSVLPASTLGLCTSCP